MPLSEDEDYLDASNSELVEQVNSRSNDLTFRRRIDDDDDYDLNQKNPSHLLANEPEEERLFLDENVDESELHRRSEAHVKQYNTFGARQSTF